ncbi:type I methionyl aminopeptidase [Brachybacterium sp. JB7]|uniref:Methionine aminopeptidase n=1 Tax=Brachybacterium alimentarium TaxID=47845 RepID=A0A2A3YJA7_9MICO|nr:MULTISPECIES: type I methionyl aminopeptidase [Brachybacterium]PCC39832.1 type I methionyl aminopeptidase [Brachybacterium alimentarium]RCS67108.1 type I methionyl aminopeptidase [Brachybacterium sp. JB7]RCS69863.1 type I methionyl aminopeptidase [Brachybacterium alimentarium]RCS78622.1 type I methionyl aminopeptidase [Brachybacterium alimentarium]RCS83875.1 type I methionyl aminopeptidase [Brachybacterium alimentarium]
MILGRRRRSSTQELPTLEQARPAGDFVASVLSHLREVVDVGWNLLEVDAEAHRLIREAGATSCYLDYHPVFGASPFGYVICTSVNDGVLHGRPRDRVLADGDLLSLDFAVAVEGWVADSCLTISVGSPRSEDQQLIRDTEQVMWAGIDQVRAGSTVGDIGHAVEREARALGYSINDRFGGHGVGRTMHEAPFVPNHGSPGQGAELVAGQLVTVEPFLVPTTSELMVDEDDGWTQLSADGSRGAHAEHTLYVTDGEPIVLTARADNPSPRSSLP